MEKIKKLKEIFNEERIDGYIITKNDEFFGEYIPEHNDRLRYISNFTGSYGFALILKNKNYLFVDGRYTLQAHSQAGKFFSIITFPNKMPKDILKNRRLVIGFDPKLFTKNIFGIFFGKNNCKFKPINNNLVDKIWKRKIKTYKNYFYQLPDSSKSESYKSKIILRGLRAVSDFEYEFQLAGMNRKLNDNIETIFLMSDVENQIISSKFVKEIVKLNGDIRKFTTKSTIKSLKEKYE